MAVHLALAGDAFGGVLFCAVIFPRNGLDEIWDYFESVPGEFSHLLLSQMDGATISPIPGYTP